MRPISNADSFFRFYENEAFSDCKVVCGQYAFKLHKVILCSQSGFFMTALKSGTFKVSYSLNFDGADVHTDLKQEGESGVIELKAKSKGDDQTDDCCDEPEVVKLMIEYFYHFDYLRSPNNERIFAPFLVEHAKVFAMAVKYQAEGLRKLAAQKFKDSILKNWNDEHLAEAIYTVYHSTPDDVVEQRDVVATVLHTRSESLKDDEDIKAIVGSTASLAYALFERNRKFSTAIYTHHHKSGSARNLEYQCDGCKGVFLYCSSCYSTRSVGIGGGATLFAGSCPFCGHFHGK